jgi:hypothetical protein
MTWVVVLALAGAALYLLSGRRSDGAVQVTPPRPMAVRFKTMPEPLAMVPAASAANLRLEDDSVKIRFFTPAIQPLPRHRTPAATLPPPDDEPDTIPIARDDGPFPGEFAAEDSPIPREPTVITSAFDPRYR